jgi:hypothetical protein
LKHVSFAFTEEEDFDIIDTLQSLQTIPKLEVLDFEIRTEDYDVKDDLTYSISDNMSVVDVVRLMEDVIYFFMER